ncbi:hypothetical protein D4764_17G0003190 [Takifugu flavidus]|uniref:Uncharacterized protein n=1 Tax=Takifugu flavidus TaxID=433684 RepID=A0A5C6NV59_9TELE|nr:hypothetical protein D4764_17G0003190 [Takifugu flavidus]
MFPANLSWTEQTAVIGTRKWRQVEDSGIHREGRREDNGPHLTETIRTHRLIERTKDAARDIAGGCPANAFSRSGERTRQRGN